MNGSFGVKDGLQLLQMVMDGLKYKKASIAKLPELVVNNSKQLINY